MIREFEFVNANNTVIKKVYCSTQAQAAAKCRFYFGENSCFIHIKPTGRKFRNVDELVSKI
jgi:hypothetical protein